jgi:hypothetical protein
LKTARQAGFNVAIVPMNAESRAKFNVEKALDWFYKFEGTPYGYHNFLFGWIDTPDKNYGPMVDKKILGPILSFASKFIPTAINSLIGEGVNKRLNTTGLTIAQLLIKSAELNMGFEDVLAIPERDEWVYSDGIS